MSEYDTFLSTSFFGQKKIEGLKKILAGGVKFFFQLQKNLRMSKLIFFGGVGALRKIAPDGADTQTNREIDRHGD